MEIHDDVGPDTVPLARPFVTGSLEMLAADLAGEFNVAEEPETLCRSVLLRAVTETASDRGVISWIEANEMVVAGCYDPFGNLVPAGSRWPLAGEHVSRLALAAGHAQTGSFREISGDGLSPALRETYDGLGHMLVAPVRIAGEDVAIVCVSRRRSEAFTAHDRAALDTVCTAAAQPLRAARLAEKLEAALTELTGLATRADAVERVKTDVLRLASHELRTPLTVLHGYLSLIGGGFFGEIPEPLNGVMKILERRTEEMNALITDMLVAARVEDSPIETAWQEADLTAMVREAVTAASPRASERHDLTFEAPLEPVMVTVDVERVALAVRNLVDNAIKYSPDGGRVVCRVAAGDGQATVRVSDQGLGIDAVDRPRLFTRFGRVVTKANSHIPGVGLGLYFCREVARRHGGDVVLLDAPGPGSTFELTLPLPG
jgi:signal transduction histidine kinase